jgi:phage-related protein
VATKPTKGAGGALLLRAMKKDAPVLSVRFFKAGDREPVREWLQGLPRAARHKIGCNIQAVQWRWPVRLPLVDGFGKGLYEVRTSLDDDIYRVLFCNVQHGMVLLHGFMKKTQRTPKADLDVARKRQKVAMEIPS